MFSYRAPKPQPGGCFKGIQCISGEQHEAVLCTLAPRSGCEAGRKGLGWQEAFRVAQGTFPKVD